MKGADVLIASVLILIISITAIFLALQLGGPSTQRTKEALLMQEGKNTLVAIDNVIKNVLTEGEGSVRVLRFSISGGYYKIDNSTNSVLFSMESRAQIIAEGISKIEDGINFTGTSGIIYLNLSYDNIMVVGEGEFGRGYHTLTIRNNGYNVTTQKQMIYISLVPLAPPTLFTFTKQYNQTQTLNITGKNTTDPNNLNDLGINTYNIIENLEPGGQSNYFQDSTENITGFNTTSADYTNNLDNQNYNVTSKLTEITQIKQYNQTGSIAVVGVNTTIPNYLNVQDGQTYNVTEYAPIWSNQSSDQESGTIQHKTTTNLYNIKTGTRSTTTGTDTVTFSSAMPSTNYSVLLSGGTDTDTMYSMAYLNKQTGSFQLKAEDDTGAGEASSNAQWIAIDFGDNTFSGVQIKCRTNNTAVASGTNTITFASAFVNTSYVVIANPIDNVDSPLINYIVGSKTTTTMQVRIENDAGSAQTVGEFDYCGFTMGEYTLSGINIKAGNNTTAASGDTNISFKTAFPSASYVVVAMAQSTSGAQCAPEVVTKNAAWFTIHFEDDAGTNCASRPFDWLAITTGESGISTPVVDTNTTYTTYNNVYSNNILNTITNIALTVNVSSYNRTGSTGKSSNPDLWLEVWDGSIWSVIGNMSVTGTGNKTVYIPQQNNIYTWWQSNPISRNIRILGRYFDANSTAWDEINYTGIWVKIDSIGDYRAEIEHNATVSYSGTLNNINVSINFTTNVTSGFNLTIYNFNSGSWDYTSCQNGIATENIWYNWWCNVNTNPSYYNSSNGVIRVRLNGTAHSNPALIREDYVQYFIAVTTTTYANISVEHNSSTISEDPLSIAKINVTTLLKTNVSSGIPFRLYIYNFSSNSWYQCSQTTINTTYSKIECVITTNSSYYISDSRIRVRLNSSGDTTTHQMMEDYLIYQITMPTQYRAEVEHNSTVSYSGTLNNISISLNFSTNSTSSPTFNFTIYNFNSANWEECYAFSPLANIWYINWCNLTSNPTNYLSSGVIRARLNETSHQNLAEVKEDYIQYYVTYTQ
jgi:hypothetical protein